MLDKKTAATAVILLPAWAGAAAPKKDEEFTGDRKLGNTLHGLKWKEGRKGVECSFSYAFR